jgi:hypothetical protein
METRLLIAYFLIGVLLVAALLFVRHVVIERREHRRIMRGHRPNKTVGRRSLVRSFRQP